MSSQTVNPSSGTSDTTDGGGAITNPGNVTASDNARASVTMAAGEVSGRLRVGYTFSGLGPYDAIGGISVDLEQRLGNSFDVVSENEVRLIVGGVPAGNNKATNALTASDAIYTHGGAADTWGLTLIGRDLLSDFGLGVRWVEASGEGGGTAEIDHAPMTVTYTARRPVTHGHYAGGL